MVKTVRDRITASVKDSFSTGRTAFKAVRM